MKITNCRFELSAFGPDHEPRDPGAEVTFLGRSNVGKSSLINQLLGTKGLARTSSQPGRTQSANFYRINETYWFIDLPGYGYARVPKAVRESWGPMVEGLLERRRERIALALLVVDARHSPRPLDLVMRDWLVTKEIPYVVAATKSDKLSGNERSKAKRLLGAEFGGQCLLVSSQSGLGIRELWRSLDRALGAKESQ